MSQEALVLKREFTVSAVTALHFFEYKSDFIFKSEYQDYWKILYVEDGSCDIVFSGRESSPVTLHPGQLFVQAPDEYYSFRAAEQTIPTLFACGFTCDSPNMSLLSNRVFSCGNTEKDLLSKLAGEGNHTFSDRITDSGTHSLERNLNRPFGGEQLIGVYLEMLLISLTRQRISPPAEQQSSGPSSLSEADSVLFNRITEYYAAHISEKVNIDGICSAFSVGRSHLQRIFREQTGQSAIEYFCQMRIHAAKQLIREDNRTLTETAKALGYTSVHYFSKQFKKITGIPPSTYRYSIRSAGTDPLSRHIGLDQKKFMSTDGPDKDLLSF